MGNGEVWQLYCMYIEKGGIAEFNINGWSLTMTLGNWKNTTCPYDWLENTSFNHILKESP